MQCSRTVEMFTTLDLVIPLKDESDETQGSTLNSSRSFGSIKFCISPDPDSTSLDINSNLTSPNPLSERDGQPLFPRERRRSSRLCDLKSELIESGAIFRPPFTPSNSLTKIKGRPAKQQIAQVPDPPPSPPPTSEARMRSASVRPGSQASSASNSARRDPSLPPIRNKYGNVRSRIDARSTHKPPPSQVRILNKPVKVEARSKVGSLANIQHVPGGGDKRIPTQKLDFKSRAQAKIDFGKAKNGQESNSSSRPTSTTPFQQPRPTGTT